MGETVEPVERVEVARIELHLAFDAGRERGLEGSVAAVGKGVRTTPIARRGGGLTRDPVGARAQRLRIAPGSGRDDLGDDRHRALRRGAGAQVEAGGAMERRDLVLGRPCFLQQPDPSGLHASRAECADVADLRLQRGHEHRVGDLVLVLHHDDRIAGAELSERGQALVEVVVIRAGQSSSAAWRSSSWANGSVPTRSRRGDRSV